MLCDRAIGSGRIGGAFRTRAGRRLVSVAALQYRLVHASFAQRIEVGGSLRVDVGVAVLVSRRHCGPLTVLDWTWSAWNQKFRRGRRSLILTEPSERRKISFYRCLSDRRPCHAEEY